MEPETFLREPRAVWLDKLLKSGICAIPPLRSGGVFDGHSRHNGMVVEVADPVLGPVQQAAPAVKITQINLYARDLA